MSEPLLRWAEPEFALVAGEALAVLVASPAAGARLADGCLRATTVRRGEAALLPARAGELLEPRRPLGAQLAEFHLARHRVSELAARDRAIDALELAGLTRPDRLVDARPEWLHPAQRARAALALALVNRPRLLVAEDAFAGLEPPEELALLDILRRLQRRHGFALLLITGNPAAAELVTGTMPRLHSEPLRGEERLGFAATGRPMEAEVRYLGEVVERGRAQDLAERPRHVYTGALSCASAVLDPVLPASAAVARRDPDRRIVLLGDLPAPGERPGGCPLHPRCPKADARCAEETPTLAEQPDGGAFACHHPLTDPELRARLGR